MYKFKRTMYASLSNVYLRMSIFIFITTKCAGMILTHDDQDRKRRTEGIIGGGGGGRLELD